MIKPRVHRGWWWGIACFSALACLSPARGQEPAAAAKPSLETPLWMDHAVPLALGDAPKDRPRVSVYLPTPTPSDKETRRGAMIICPGGGYGVLAIDHEGYQIAAWANEMGLVAVICHYRHRGDGYGHPVPWLDACQAIRLTRANAEAWQVDPQRVGIIGFSAGGHLVSTVLTQFDRPSNDVPEPLRRVSARPDYGILCYPVIGLGTDYGHAGSLRNLLGESPADDLVQSLRSDLNVTPNTPPTFLMHTQADDVVRVKNSLVFYDALQQHGVPSELHLFPQGAHGVGLARTVPGAKAWPQLCRSWLESLGVVRGL